MRVDLCALGSVLFFVDKHEVKKIERKLFGFGQNVIIIWTFKKLMNNFSCLVFFIGFSLWSFWIKSSDYE